MSGNDGGESDGLFAGKPAPTGNYVFHRSRGRHRINVGAGLPAMAVRQAMMVVNLMASSRASPLPQGIMFFTGFVDDTDPMWE
jgi:hypothetical protein